MDFKDNYSKGCKACQKGKWLCIFLTYQCNASCDFCPAPNRNKDIIHSSLGDNYKLILKYLNRYPFEGLSFSGGEYFLVYDRLLKWLKFFKENKADLYYWAYTNGINVKRHQMEALHRSGLNELRFNIAASGYNNALVLKTIAAASLIFDHVAVEIPSIPEDLNKFKDLLPELDKIGVEYLNLHEYILMPNDQGFHTAPRERFLLNYEINLEYHLQSFSNTEQIMQICRKEI